MNVITVTREYGAGGAELAQMLAEQLGWELLDRQLLHQAAAIENVPDADMERLDEKALSITDHFRMHPPHERYMHGLQAAVVDGRRGERTRHLRESQPTKRRAKECRVVVGDERSGDDRLDSLVAVDKGPRRDRPVRTAHTQADVIAQIIDPLGPFPAA